MNSILFNGGKTIPVNRRLGQQTYLGEKKLPLVSFIKITEGMKTKRKKKIKKSQIKIMN